MDRQCMPHLHCRDWQEFWSCKRVNILADWITIVVTTCAYEVLDFLRHAYTSMTWVLLTTHLLPALSRTSC